MESKFHYRPSGIKNLWDVFRGALLRCAQDWRNREKKMKLKHEDQMYGNGIPSVIETGQFPGISAALKRVKIRFVFFFFMESFFSECLCLEKAKFSRKLDW